MLRVRGRRLVLSSLPARARRKRRPHNARLPGRRMQAFGLDKRRYALWIPLFLVLILLCGHLKNPGVAARRFSPGETSPRVCESLRQVRCKAKIRGGYRLRIELETENPKGESILLSLGKDGETCVGQETVLPELPGLHRAYVCLDVPEALSGMCVLSLSDPETLAPCPLLDVEII